MSDEAALLEAYFLGFWFPTDIAGYAPKARGQYQRKIFAGRDVCREECEIKKGAGASPPYILLDPRNRNSVEVAFRPPREANLVVGDR